MDNLTELYCLMDDFCKKFEPEFKRYLLQSGKRKRQRSGYLSLAELMTLVVLFHQIRYRQFKLFYLLHVCQNLRGEFPRLPSYQRIVELMPRCVGALAVLFEVLKGKCTAISIVDSTSIRVCHNLRIRRHRVFKEMAARGKSSTGWFFGFKLHAIINHRGELLQAKLTPGNKDDRQALKGMTSSLFGKLFADRGYIGEWLKDWCRTQNIELITKVRKNMKPVTHSDFDQAVLKGRSVIETVFDELKNMCQIEHSRHRSVFNFTTNLIAGLVAYCLFPNKPSLHIQHRKQKILIPN